MCIFCSIIEGKAAAEIVYQDENAVGFLDLHPLFPGHTLLVPREHHETLPDLPLESVAPLFAAARLLSKAIPEAMGAAGSFVALNNKVSQSVPHVHVHVVPRNFKDGLKGFFWPRKDYENEAHLAETGAAIRRAVEDNR